jgi:hypothetical protein
VWGRGQGGESAGEHLLTHHFAGDEEDGLDLI